MTQPLPAMRLYRHPEIQTGRPYGFDIDAKGWLWESWSSDRLYAHHLATGACRLVRLTETRGHSINQILCYQGKLIGIIPDDPSYLVYDPATGATSYPMLPGTLPIVWYAIVLPDGRLALFDRGEGKIILLDAPGADPRVVACPFPPSPSTGSIAMGQMCSDGLLYLPIREPARLVRFDPATNRFVDAIPFAQPEAGPSGYFEADGVLYIADSAAGRLLPYDLRAGRWQEPIPIPGYGTVFGFVGAATPFRGRGYYSLSTYRFISSINPDTGELNLPEGWDKGVDGRPPRFLDRQLVFDPTSGTFDYLTVPAQPDGMPLICYTYADADRLVFTGYNIPFDAQSNPSDQPGDWLVWQSV